MKRTVVEIPYNKGKITLKIPEKNLGELLKAEPIPSPFPQDPADWGWEHGTEGASLPDFFASADDVLIIVNDHARPTPTAVILESIERYIPWEKSSFIIATGTHRASTPKELEVIFGRNLPRVKSRVIMHQAKEDHTMFSVGKTVSGKELALNRALERVDSVLVIGSVEPHYFAGFTGGRKGLMPGIANYDAVEANHSLAMSREAAPMKLAGNPVHEEMDSCLDLFSRWRIYSIQAVLNRDGSIYHISHGDIRKSLLEAAERASKVFSLPASQMADLVIAVAVPPLDIDLYQSQKAMEHARRILKPGGILMLYSPCHDGIGPANFYELLSSGKTLDEIRLELKYGYKLGFHKTARFLDLYKSSSLWVKSELAPQVLRKIYITPIEDAQKSLDDALEILGGDARVSVLYDASTMVPVLNS